MSTLDHTLQSTSELLTSTKNDLPTSVTPVERKGSFEPTSPGSELSATSATEGATANFKEPSKDRIKRMLQSYYRTPDHQTAATLAFKITALTPGLIRYVEALEKALSATPLTTSKGSVRKLKFKCEWCGKDFKVTASAVKHGKVSGKYCSAQCYNDDSINNPENRGSEAKSALALKLEILKKKKKASHSG